MTETLLLLSNDIPEHIAAQGFSGNWALKPSRAINCDYAIICDMPEGNGVMVGRVRGVMRTDDPARYEVHFSETVRIDVPNVWNRMSRNPVGYVQSAKLPVDFAKLEFQPV